MNLSFSEEVKTKLAFLKEYHEYLQGKDGIIKNNHDFSLSIYLIKLINSLQTVYEKMEKLKTETNEEEKESLKNSIKLMWKFYNDSYKKINDEYNLEDLEKTVKVNIESDLFVEENFHFSKKELIGINQLLIGKNGAYLLYMNFEKGNLKIFNLTSVKNGNHVSVDGSFCSGNTFDLLMGLYRKDVSSFLGMLAKILADHDDGAYHMAEKNSFENWRKFMKVYLDGDGKEANESTENLRKNILSVYDEKLKTSIGYLEKMLSKEGKEYIKSTGKDLKEFLTYVGK